MMHNYSSTETLDKICSTKPLYNISRGFAPLPMPVGAHVYGHTCLHTFIYSIS